jgi:hypothetical protein
MFDACVARDVRVRFLDDDNVWIAPAHHQTAGPPDLGVAPLLARAG